MGGKIEDMIKIIPLEFVKVIENGFQCIWSPENGVCFYNPYNPPIYFSLGDTLTAVGLLFAVIQLISPIKKVTLSIKGFKNRVLWFSIGIALLFIFIAANVPQLQNLNLPHPLNYALVWELASFSIFILVITRFWFQASLNKNIFKVLLPDHIEFSENKFWTSQRDGTKIVLKA